MLLLLALLGCGTPPTPPTEASVPPRTIEPTDPTEQIVRPSPEGHDAETPPETTSAGTPDSESTSGEPSECVTACERRNMARAVAPETIRADCEEECGEAE